MKYKQFVTKEEKFAYLLANKSDIINLKKSVTKFTDSFGVTESHLRIIKAVDKALAEKVVSVPDNGSIVKTIVGNTYNWMDSHDDVHIDGIFTKSLQENKQNVLHLHDHLQQVAAKVGIPSDVYEKQIAWTDLGVDKTGNTTALMMDTKVVKDLNPSIFYQYSENQIKQHSVGMQYVNLFMCVNSTEPEYKEEYANWLKYYPMVGNQSDALDQGYFFAVTEAKLKEISCVTKGSNELTPTLDDIEQPDDSTDQKQEPLKDTHRKQFLLNPNLF